MQRVTKLTSLRTAASSQLSEEAIQRICAAKASRRGGRRDSSHRHPTTHGGHHGRGGWRERQPRTEQQAAPLRNFKSATAEVNDERSGASTSQEEVKKQRPLENFTHGRFGRFSSPRPLIAEQTTAGFGGDYRGMEPGVPFGGVGPAHKKEWMQQCSAAREALRSAHVSPPSGTQPTPRQAEATPLLNGREWSAHPGRPGGRHGRGGRSYHARY